MVHSQHTKKGNFENYIIPLGIAWVFISFIMGIFLLTSKPASKNVVSTAAPYVKKDVSAQEVIPGKTTVDTSVSIIQPATIKTEVKIK